MNLSNTFSYYMAKRYLQIFLVALISLSLVVALFDFIELLRRASDKPDVGFGLLIQMQLYRLPLMMEKILPFSVLFSGLYIFLRMTRTRELIVARAAGVSVWQFILPVMLSAFSIGLLSLMLFNPVASYTARTFERMELKYFENSESIIDISGNGVWLRQMSGDTQAILHSESFNESAMSLPQVSIILLDSEDGFKARIEAQQADLKDGYWLIQNARVFDRNLNERTLQSARLSTPLTQEDILNRFASPDTLSFWELRGFIDVLENAGFSAQRHKFHLNALISQPVLLCAMILVAACFSLTTSRIPRPLMMIVGALLAGFGLYFLNDVASALGMSAKIPIVLAAWTPPLMGVFLASSFLLHSEDG